MSESHERGAIYLVAPHPGPYFLRLPEGPPLRKAKPPLMRAAWPRGKVLRLFDLALHHVKEFLIGLGVFQLTKEEFTGRHFIHRLQNLP